MDSLKNRPHPLATNLNETDKKNFTVLAERKKGELLKVENGKLVPMNFIESLTYRLFGAKKGELEILKQTIDNLTAKLSVNNDLSEEQGKAVNQFFIKKMGSLSTKIYSRSIHESVYQFMEKSLKGRSLSSTQKAAAIWGQLGNIKPLAAGASGSYVIVEGARMECKKIINESNKGREIGIFKPSNEDTLSPNNPHWKTTAMRLASRTILAPFTGSLLHMTQGQSMFAERAAHITEQYLLLAISRALKNSIFKNDQNFLINLLKLVPETEMLNIELPGKGKLDGSHQEWIHSSMTEIPVRGEEFLHTDKNFNGPMLELTDENKHKLSLIFDIMIIYGIIHGDTDRHAENFFIMTNNNGEITGLRLIDNGRAMSDTHPGFWGRIQANKETIWKKHAIANEPVSDFAKAVMQELWELKPEILADYRALYHTVKDPYAENRAARAEERMAIFTLAKDSSRLTKRDLADQIENIHKVHTVLISGTVAAQPSIGKLS